MREKSLSRRVFGRWRSLFGRKCATKIYQISRDADEVRQKTSLSALWKFSLDEIWCKKFTESNERFIRCWGINFCTLRAHWESVGESRIRIRFEFWRTTTDGPAQPAPKATTTKNRAAETIMKSWRKKCTLQLQMFGTLGERNNEGSRVFNIPKIMNILLFAREIKTLGESLDTVFVSFYVWF